MFILLTLAILKSSLVWSGISQVSLDPFLLPLCPAVHVCAFPKMMVYNLLWRGSLSLRSHELAVSIQTALV